MIEIKNITKIYNPGKSNEFTALKDISLTIGDGEMTAIIGKSGAGKSTLLHIQSGHDTDHGMILAEDLQNTLIVPEYEEPEENYVIIKTKQEYINERGSNYEATRKYWKMKLDRAQKYHYVVSAVQGIVKAVYEVKEWRQSEEEGETDRIEFVGKLTKNDNMQKLIGKRLPAQYTKQGLASPFLYIDNK